MAMEVWNHKVCALVKMSFSRKVYAINNCNILSFVQSVTG